MIFAINLFKDSSLDFVDCLLISYNNVLGQHIISFDKKLVSRLLYRFTRSTMVLGEILF